MEFVTFAPEHLDGVVALCRAQGWPSFVNDPQRAQKALTAAGRGSAKGSPRRRTARRFTSKVLSLGRFCAVVRACVAKETRYILGLH